MNPNYGQTRNQKLEFLFRPLFLPIETSGKKSPKKKKQNIDKKGRLYYHKPDYAKVFEERGKYLLESRSTS